MNVNEGLERVPDAAQRISAASGIPAEDLEGKHMVWLFPQMWGNTACGFPGIAGQAFTEAMTVVVMFVDVPYAAVYFRGRFAYLVENPTEAFTHAVGQERLPGASTRIAGERLQELGTRVTLFDGEVVA